MSDISKQFEDIVKGQNIGSDAQSQEAVARMAAAAKKDCQDQTHGIHAASEQIRRYNAAISTAQTNPDPKILPDPEGFISMMTPERDRWVSIFNKMHKERFGADTPITDTCKDCGQVFTHLARQ